MSERRPPRPNTPEAHHDRTEPSAVGPASSMVDEDASDDATSAHDGEGPEPKPRTGGDGELLRDDLYGEDEELPELGDLPDDGSGFRPNEERSRVTGTHSKLPREAPPPGENGEPGESTWVGRPVRLEVTDGPDAGRRKRFNGVRMLIGRAPEADLVLSDAAVSRHHVEIIGGDGGVLLRDLGSGNGTLVNGAKASEQLLEHLDKIALGKTQLLFFDAARAAEIEEEERKAQEEADRLAEEERVAAEAAAAEAAEAEAAEGEGAGEEGAEGEAAAEESGPPVPLTPKEKLLAEVARFRALTWKQKSAYAAVLLAFLGAMITGLVVLFTAEPKPLPSTIPSTVLVKLEDARLLMVAGRFSEAIEFLESAESAHAGSDKQGLANALKNELAVAKQLDDVETLITQGQLAQAGAALDEIPEGSTVVESRREAIRSNLEARIVEANEAELAAALDDADFTAARAIVERFPEEKRQDLFARIDTAETDWNAQQSASEERAEEMRQESERRKAAVRASFLDASFSAVERKFESGDYARATLEVDRVAEAHDDDDIQERARLLKRLIPAFATAYEDAERKLKQGAPESAVRPLKRAKSLLARIGFSGALSRIIDGKLATVLLTTGRAQLSRNDWTGASDSFRDAARLAPGDDRTQVGLAQLQRKGESLYREAYAIKANDPRGAADKLRIVIEILPPDSMIARQAKSLLVELRTRH